jgi:hypothetical protein
MSAKLVIASSLFLLLISCIPLIITPKNILVQRSPPVASSASTYNVGDKGPAGGIIFYKSAAGFEIAGADGIFHYFEVASTEMSGPWGLSGIKTDETLLSLGAGYQNTRILIAHNIETWSVGALCYEYRGGGKGDWFLPSYSELSTLYKSNVITTNNILWSSSEYSSLFARSQNFSTGYQDQAMQKRDVAHARPIRAF